MTDDYLRIGQIIKTHGLKGAVKVYPTTDDTTRFLAGNRCYIDTNDGTVPVTIKSVSSFKKLFIVTFEEFCDINQIEKYKGCDIIIEKGEADTLLDNEYYIDDLMDMEVFDDEDVYLGRITEVISTGANDVYQVSDGKRDILIPAIRECILSVEVEANRMCVHLMKGLI